MCIFGLYSEDRDLVEEPNLASHNFTNKGRCHKPYYHREYKETQLTVRESGCPDTLTPQPCTDSDRMMG